MHNLKLKYGGDTPVELEICHKPVEFFVYPNTFNQEMTILKNEIN